MTQELKKTIVHNAIYYGRDMPPEVLKLMCEDLRDLDPAKCIAAYAIYRQNPKNKTFPLPAQIREIVVPEEFISPEVMARELASRIVGAVTRFGWCNPNEAKDYIGNEAWQCVLRQGGWMHVCQNLGTNINPTTFQAQIRDQLEGSIRYGAAAIEKNIKESLAERNQCEELVAAGSVLKSIPSLDC